MRKRMIGTMPKEAVQDGTAWLPLDQIALVEVSSEDPAHPIENALTFDMPTGWRAERPGEQIVRLIFDQPQPLRRIHLLFMEHDVEREQEFVLRWSSDNGQTFHEIVRQQWNFNPLNAAQEIEDYQVNLAGVTQLELKIVPDRSGGAARASLEQMRLA